VSSRTLSSTTLSYFLYSKLAGTAVAPPGLAQAVATVALKPSLAAMGTAQMAEQIAYHMVVVQAKWVATSLAAALLLCVGGGAAVFSALGQDHSHPQHPVQRDVENR